jgi:hypothetical protein
MTTRDDGRPGDDSTPGSPTQGRPGQRRALVVAGVAGVAAVLGGGAYVATSAIVPKDSTTATEIATPVRLVTPAHSPSSE